MSEWRDAAAFARYQGEGEDDDPPPPEPDEDVRPAAHGCVVCGAPASAHTDIRDGLSGHEVQMPGMPQDGRWHPFSADKDEPEIEVPF